MLFKIKFFEISCSPMQLKEPGTRTMVSHEHLRQIGCCRYNNLDSITYDNPTVQNMCLAPLAANFSIMDIYNRLSRTTRYNELNFHQNCPFIRGLGLDMREYGLVSPEDELPNIYSELYECLKSADANSHIKVVTTETVVYVHSSFNDTHQFISNITQMHHPVTMRIISVSKLGISHPKRSLRNAGMGDTLELLTMRFRQRTCSICCTGIDGDYSDRRDTCLPCSHMYHEDCIMLYLIKNSSCPVCGYQISFDKVECELSSDWPRRHKRNGPNLFKIIERVAYMIQGSCDPLVVGLLVAVMFKPTIIFLDDIIRHNHLRRLNAEFERSRRAVVQKGEKGEHDIVKLVSSKVLNYCRNSFRQSFKRSSELSGN